MRVLTVKRATNVDGVQSSFLGDRSVSKRLHHTPLSFPYVEAYVIDLVCGSYFGVLESA